VARKRINARLRAPCIAVAIVLIVGLFSTKAAGTPSWDVPTAHKLLNGVGYVLLSETQNADGTYTDTWALGLAQVSVTGRAGMTATVQRQITAKGGSDGVSVTAPPIDKSRGSAYYLDQYATFGRSTYELAIANGADVETALRVSGVDGYSAHRAAGLARPMAAPIIDSFFASTTSPSGYVRTDACTTRYLDQDNGGSDWYIADQSQESGRSTDVRSWFPDRLTRIYEYLFYPTNNQFVQWDPGTTRPEPSSCAQVTVGISSARTGVGYSVSQSVCADSFGPFQLDTGTSYPRFGSVWNGYEPQSGWYEGTAAVDLLHSPPGSSINATLSIWQDWCNC
jgi:hypothetical protein